MVREVTFLLLLCVFRIQFLAAIIPLPMFFRFLALFSISPFLGTLAQAVEPEALSRLLLEGRCEECDLRSADLVHADLAEARLRGAQLQSANLSQANLDNADLQGADLSGCTLAGASLRGADLRSAQLRGVDLRSADLTGALLDDSALTRSHWRGAVGVRRDWLNAAQFHNAAVAEAEAGRWPAAERLFSAAIELSNNEPLSWAGRGVSRGFQGKVALAASDFSTAERLSRAQGDLQSAKRLKQLQLEVLENPEPRLTKAGNGLGGAALDGVAQSVKPFSSVLQSIAPLALKFLLPVPF